jgi:precorrin-4 methylase
LERERLERRGYLKDLTTGADREAARRRAVVVVGDVVGVEVVEEDEDDKVPDQRMRASIP